MRVCPHCGYQDPRYWKHAKWSYHIDTCNWESFKIEYPELAISLKRGGDLTEDKDYVYRITKNMHVVQRKAEIEVFKELSRRGLTAGMMTQLDIILKYTRPDFAWFERKLAVYLDGEQVHRKRQEKDEEIDNLLETQGWG
jgi:very-short-patch-repair endonuclease